MSQKPEALRLATILDSLGWRSADSELREASAMLRNQHAEIERLRAELAESATDLSRVLETVKYLSGIAERGEGRKIGESETVEQFVLGYVQQLETEAVRLRTKLEALRNQEPVAWMNVRNGFICKKPTNADYQQPLYPAAGAQPVQSKWEVKIGEKLLPSAQPAPSAPEAPKRKPLTDEQIDAIMQNPSDFGMYQPPWSGSDITILRAMARAVEAAHGIKE